MGPSKKELFGYVVLIATVFGGALYFFVQKPNPASEHSARHVVSLKGGDKQQPARATPSIPSPPASVSDLQLISSAAAQGRAPEEEREVSEQELQDRTWMVKTLGDSPSLTSVEALSHVLRTSGDKRERLEAVSALEHIAAAGGPTEEVMRALALAELDRSPEIAASARDASRRAGIAER